jgi:hypothetical protein
MKFMVFRSTQGAVSDRPPCSDAIRGAESPAWPGEYSWYVDLPTLEDLLHFLEANGGALALYSPEEGEDVPAIEIFDDDEQEDDAS